MNTNKQINRYLLLVSTLAGFASKATGAGLMFVSGVLLARLLGVENFGMYSLVMSVSTILASVAILGLPTLLVREVAVLVEGQRWAELSGLLIFSQRSVGVGVCIASLIMIIVALIWHDSTWRWVWLSSTLLMPLLGYNQIRAATLRGLHSVILADIPELLLRPAMILVMVGVALLLLPAAGAVWAVGMQIIAAMMAFLLGSMLLRRRLPKAVAVHKTEIQSHKWFVAALPFWVITIIGITEQQLALLLLGGVSGPRAAGLYQAAAQLVALVAFGLLAVNMALQPKIARAWSIGDRSQVQHLATMAVRLSAVVALVVGGVLLLFAERLLGLFGQDFVQSAPVLQVLVIGQMINALAGSCGVVLAMTGNQREVLHGMVIALVVDATLGLVLIPGWNIMGAAIASTAGLASWNFYLAYRAKRHMGISTALH